MSNYKRIFLDNHYYFLTVIIDNRKLTLLTDYIDEFKLALKTVKSQYAFDLHAISVMPDHYAKCCQGVSNNHCLYKKKFYQIIR